jgi:hypothetical protein
MINWNSVSIIDEIKKIGDIHVQSRILKENAAKKLYHKDIDYWFRETAEGDRKSLGKRISDYGSSEQANQIKQHFYSVLDNKEVSWKTITMIIVVNKCQ